MPPLARWWRTALPLVALAVLTPGVAKAECGDYVIIRNAPAQSGRHHSPPADADYPAADHQTPAPAKPPCHGPNCSGNPGREAPPMVPAPVSGPHPKQPAQPVEPPAGITPEPGLDFDSSLLSVHPVSRAESIFHPPRHG
jgi:hypothetical protein